MSIGEPHRAPARQAEIIFLYCDRSEAADQLAKPALPRLGRRTAAGHQPIGFLIPATARVVVAEHGRILLGLLDEAERQVALDEALQRFRDMRRRLVIVDDALETVYRRQILAAVQVIAT